MDDCVVEIGEIDFYTDSSALVFNFTDVYAFITSFFKKEAQKQKLKMALSKSLEYASMKLNILKWDVKFRINVPNRFIEESKDNVIFVLDVCGESEKYHFGYFKTKLYENRHFAIPKTELNLSNVNKIEDEFCKYLNDKCFYIKQYIPVGYDNVRKILKEKHDENFKIFDCVDKMFDYKYSSILNNYTIEYTIGEKVFIYHDLDKLSSEDNLSCKSVLKYLFSKGVFSNITEAEFESILESDDIESIVENIKLLSY